MHPLVAKLNLKLELLLVHILTFAGQNDERVLPTRVALAPNSGCITSPGDDCSPISRLACHCPDCVAGLALQADICGLVLHSPSLGLNAAI